MSSSDWIAFYDSKHWIYVNARHRTAHYSGIAEALRMFAPPDGVMLDFGCGEALFADRVAEPAARLILCEAAPNVRMALATHFAGNSKIAVRKPEDIETMTSQTIDVIIMHSVAQYLSAGELDRHLTLFRRLLRSGGLLVLSDIVPRGRSAAGDALDLLLFGARQGFLGAAMVGLLLTSLSGYRRLRQSVGLSRYDEDEVTAKLAAAGFSPERARPNIGHSSKRMTFLAHVASGSLFTGG